MLISSDEGAGELMASGEDTRFYDDIRCMAADWAARHDASATAFVHLRDGTWAEAQSAFYARPLSAHTAMGSGLTAFATADQARAADRSGRSSTWAEVVTRAGDDQ